MRHATDSVTFPSSTFSWAPHAGYRTDVQSIPLFTIGFGELQLGQRVRIRVPSFLSLMIRRMAFGIRSRVASLQVTADELSGFLVAQNF